MPSKLSLFIYIIISAYITMSFKHPNPIYYRFFLAFASIYVTKEIVFGILRLLGSLASNVFRLSMFAFYVVILAIALSEFKLIKNNMGDDWKHIVGNSVLR